MYLSSFIHKIQKEAHVIKQARFQLRKGQTKGLIFSPLYCGAVFDSGV